MSELLLTPVDRFIRDQQDLSAVERFADRHDARALHRHDEPVVHEYRDLLPAAGPAPGQQYAFEVDLDACTGCKACVSACHHLNGLDEQETWRSVGVLHGTAPAPAAPPGWRGSSPAPRLQHVTTACHHCVEPACLAGCPVDAYEKDPVTGIVAHLDDQCIGCRYCTLTCPYEVPVYDHRRGIVRKCDLCRDRLAEGEAPACVQGCPTEAISISVVNVSEVVASAGATPGDGVARLVPGAPASSTTVPTTHYRSAVPLPSTMVAADRYSLQPSTAHTPLAVMLVLTQVSVGALLIAFALGPRLHVAPRWTGTVALALGVGALGASLLHLGRPQLAWRAALGLRHSWLSREIVAFGLFAGLAAADATASWLGAGRGVTAGLDVAVAVVGIVGVGCSVLIYTATRRRWWSKGRVTTRFVTTAVTGGSALLVTIVVAGAVPGDDDASGSVLASGVPLLAVLLLVGTLLGLAAELEVLLPAHRRAAELDRTARLLAGELRGLLVARVALGLAGGVVLPVVLLAVAGDPTPSRVVALLCASAMLVAVVAGELCERRLFFLAVSPPRMPGALR